MLDKLIDRFCHLFKWLMGLCLALMVVLVFGNVFMRYALNSGITVSEELSRWLFVWMTFLGATVALREHGHLGTDMLVGKLGPQGKRWCLGLSYLLMMATCALVFQGAWAQTRINWASTSAVMEVSMAWVYIPGLVFAALGGLILLVELYKLLSGRVRDDDLQAFKESEEAPHGGNATAKDIHS
ncbi:TRAP transporter small permease [Limnohabitans sp.]|uniref:TRAP transporter small permease n=1 Tax=Limnohabitans sp. TaxID=1907725 RepID=UPI00391B85ED